MLDIVKKSVSKIYTQFWPPYQTLEERQALLVSYTFLLCCVLVFILSFLLAGCASTTVSFSPTGEVLSITHRRFVIDEQFSVKGGPAWTADCRSKPDEASVALAKGLVDLAAKAGAK